MDIIAYQNRTAEFNFVIRNGDEFYRLTSGEKLILGAKTGPDADNYLIYKELTEADIDDDDHDNSSYALTLTALDTNIPAGSYYWDMALWRSDTDVIPVFYPGEFILKPSCVIVDSNSINENE